MMARARSFRPDPAIPLRESPRKRKRSRSANEQPIRPKDEQLVEDGTKAKHPPSKKTASGSMTAATTGNKEFSISQTSALKQEFEDAPQSKPDLKTLTNERKPKFAESPKKNPKVDINRPKIEGKSDTGKKRKTKEEKEAEAMPLAARTLGLKMYVGAHVSIAKGVENAVTNAVHIGGNAFALFLKSQRKWENPPLKAENRDAFRKACTDHEFDPSSHVVPHGSYLVNLATPDKDKAKQAYTAFVDDLHRCEALGIRHYNFHPGSTNQEPLDEAINRISENLNRALSETSTVVPLLENMAGRGSVIGSRFSDLRDIIAGIKPEFKSRIGICIDTCHAFAAGYDLRSPEAYQKTIKELDDVVGLKYLKAMHINDSKAPFESHRDLHQNIGVGFLGLRAFHNVMNDSRLQDIPLVLETPCDRPDPTDPKGKKTVDDKRVWSGEIKLLESLIGMDPEGSEFKRLEKELSDQGLAERIKMEASVIATEEKKRKKLEKGQKSISDILGAKGKQGKGQQATPASNSEESEASEV